MPSEICSGSSAPENMLMSNDENVLMLNVNLSGKRQDHLPHPQFFISSKHSFCRSVGRPMAPGDIIVLFNYLFFKL